MIISLERSSYTVNETSDFVEVCAVLIGQGVVEGAIMVDIHTESISATGEPSVLCTTEVGCSGSTTRLVTHMNFGYS